MVKTAQILIQVSWIPLDFKRVALCILILFLSVSCTRLSLGFKVAEYYIPSKIDDYIDSDSTQKKIIDEKSKDFLNSIKVEVLPDLRKTILLLVSDIKNNKLNLEQVKLYQHIFRDLSKKAIHYTQPGINELCLSLKPSQFEYLAKSLTKDNDEAREKLTSGKRFEKMVDSWTTNFERFIGSLTDKQEAKLKQALNEMQPFLQHELAGRERNLKTLQDNLQKKEVICKWFEDWSKDFDSIRTSEYAHAQKTYQNQGAELIFNIFQDLSSEQKSNLLKELQNLVEEIQTAEATK